MSNLRKRHLTKKISRPNGLKAILRIEAELKVLIDNAPNAERMPLSTENARERLAAGLSWLKPLYQPL